MFFYNGCGDREVRCNGRSELLALRKDQCDSAIPKSYKHTQTLALRKARGIVRFWEGWCGVRGGRDCDCLEIFRLVLLSISIPTVTARNSFRIVKAGLSKYCTASEKTESAVPPPLFRGEARVLAIFEG